MHIDHIEIDVYIFRYLKECVHIYIYIEVLCLFICLSIESIHQSIHASTAPKFD